MASYRDWNEALRRHFFGAEFGGSVYLALDDDTLDELAQELQQTTDYRSSGAAMPASAVDDFCHAVREDVQARGWLPDQPADCLARCCLFVLAYSRVEGSGKAGAPAYWGQVRGLLDPAQVSTTGAFGSFGLDQSIFQELWTRARDEFQLELPETNAPGEKRWSGQLCNVNLLRAQAGLRQLDLSHVRAMFDEPRGSRRLTGTASATEACAWIEEKKLHLTPYAQRVWARNPDLARRQVCKEWQSYQSAAMERPPTLAGVRIAIRRGAGRPSADLRLYVQLDIGCRSLTAYRRRALIADELLASELTRLKDHVWVFDDLYERFHPERSTAPGRRVLLFRQERLLPGEWAALSELSSSVRCWRATELRGLPAGWVLVHCRTIYRPTTVNPFSWVVANFRLSGGLRVDTRQWLTGAGPVVRAKGVSEVDVDGAPWRLECGTADLSGLAPGSHEVRCGGQVEHFDIVPAKRVAGLRDHGRWVWRGETSWPVFEACATVATRWLDGAFFVETGGEDQVDSPSTATGVDLALRRRPMLEDVQRAFAGGEAAALLFAAVARGRR